MHVANSSSCQLLLLLGGKRRRDNRHNERVLGRRLLYDWCNIRRRLKLRRRRQRVRLLWLLLRLSLLTVLGTRIILRYTYGPRRRCWTKGLLLLLLLLLLHLRWYGTYDGRMLIRCHMVHFVLGCFIDCRPVMMMSLRRGRRGNHLFTLSRGRWPRLFHSHGGGILNLRHLGLV